MKNILIKILVYVIIFAIGFCCCYFLQPNKTETEVHIVDEITSTVIVTNTIKEVYKEETNQKTEEKEKIIIRKIAVPCQCSNQQQTTAQNDVNGQNSNKNDFPLTLPKSELKLSENGYMLIYEEIRENERKDESSHSVYTEKEQSNSSLNQTSSLKTEDKKETKIEKDTDILIGIGVGSSLSKFDLKYSVGAHKKIIGPFWIGAEVETNKKLDFSVKLNASLGF